MKNNYWEHKELTEFSQQEWEDLCDGCGKCCLEKLYDEENNIIYTTCVSCRLLDPHTCKCNNYKKRFSYIDDCIKLTPNKIKKLPWIPSTCAYRLIAEKKPLPSWHPLITGDKDSTIKSGNSVKEQVVHPALLNKDDDLINYIIEETKL